MKFNMLFWMILFSFMLSNPIYSSENYNDNWPTWRGPLATGEAVSGAPPVKWSETENIKWKTPISGKGQSTPVIWEDQIFITTAIELDEKASKEAIKRLKKRSHKVGRLLRVLKTTEKFQQFVVYSINRETGKINWQKIVREQYPHEGTQRNGSWAAPSCVTDGEYMIASFGSYGFYCFDMAGNLIWEKDLGDMHVDGPFGEGTSPALYENKLIIVWDHQGQSKIYVLDKSTGEEIWQRDRDEITTWATPVVAELADNVQIIVNGRTSSIGYDIANGDIIWELSGLDGDIIPSPVCNADMAFLMSGSVFGRDKKLLALNLLTAKGIMADSNAVAWTYNKKMPYVPSPLLKNKKLYYLQGSSSRISCVETMTGKIHYLGQKIKGMKSTYASPVTANGYIYILDRKGNCTVIKEGAEFKIIAQNKLDDNFDASPAVVGNELVLRGLKHVYCISK